MASLIEPSKECYIQLTMQHCSGLFWGMYVIRFILIVCIVSQTHKQNLQQCLSAVPLSTDNHQHLPNKRSFILFVAGVGHFGNAVIIKLGYFWWKKNKTKYRTITGTTARYQGHDDCKSAVWGSHRYLQHDAASDQQFPAYERHWDPSECWALVTKTCAAIVWVSQTMRSAVAISMWSDGILTIALLINELNDSWCLTQ